MVVRRTFDLTHGGEFVDDGAYGGEPPPGAVIVQLPIAVVLALADRQLLSVVPSDQAYLAELTASIRAEGIRVPLEVMLDPAGRARLKEGHHRTYVAREIGLQHLPVKFVPFGSVMQAGYQQFFLSELMEFVQPLLDAIKEASLKTARQGTR